MKIYTRTGDDGTTGLFGGPRVKKHDPRIQAIGQVDETNAAIGCALALLDDASAIPAGVQRIQHDLFDLGADLATPEDSRATVQRIGTDHVKDLEALIDRLEQDLPPLRNFILPGGSPASAQLHFARTVCRRAERALARAFEHDSLNPFTLQYLNRLSDVLFVLARWLNRAQNTDDVLWTPRAD